MLSLNVIATWSEFKSWLNEKKRKPESALSQVEQQKLQHVHKLQHVQQLVGGTLHLWSEAVRWSEASSELREQAVQVFQLQVRFGTHSLYVCSLSVPMCGVYGIMVCG